MYKRNNEIHKQILHHNKDMNWKKTDRKGGQDSNTGVSKGKVRSSDETRQEEEGSEDGGRLKDGKERRERRMIKK